MSELWGADPDQLDALASRLVESAGRVDELAAGCRASLRTTAWQGRDAEQFEARWSSEGVRLLGTAATTLRQAGACVRTNAAAQRTASAAEGGAFGAAGAGGPGGSATGPAGALQPGASYAAQIVATRQSMEAELARRQAHLAELQERLRHADGGIEEWIKDTIPFWDSDAEALQGQIDGERQAIDRLQALLRDPSRQFLKVDVGGDGRIVEVHGDLAGADHVALFVPGMDTSIDNYTDHPHDYSTHLFEEMARRSAPGTHVAVVSYLDYNPPDLDWSLPLGAGELRATEGAKNLAGFVAGLRDSGYRADQLTVVGHSYGSTVTGIALEHEHLGVSTVAVVGSPGLGDGVDDISDLHRPDVHLYAGRAEGVPVPFVGDGDPVSWLPFHGEDPADSGFGADRFATGSVTGHSGYFDPHSESLRNLALIALGQQPTMRR